MKVDDIDSLERQTGLLWSAVIEVVKEKKILENMVKDLLVRMEAVEKQQQQQKLPD